MVKIHNRTGVVNRQKLAFSIDLILDHFIFDSYAAYVVAASVYSFGKRVQNMVERGHVSNYKFRRFSAML